MRAVTLRFCTSAAPAFASARESRSGNSESGGFCTMRVFTLRVEMFTNALKMFSPWAKKNEERVEGDLHSPMEGWVRINALDLQNAKR